MKNPKENFINQEPTTETPTSKIGGEQEKNEYQTKTYEINGEKFDVSWKEFNPKENENPPQGQAVFFLPGWAAGDAKTLDVLMDEFAKTSGKKSFMVTSRSEGIVEDSLTKEAEAIRQLVKEKGITNITLAAHSQGGSKSANLISFLQKENPEVTIEGLILLDPVGVYGQQEGELTKNFVKDTLIDTPEMIAKDYMDNRPFEQKRRAKSSLKPAVMALEAGSDIVFNIVKEVKKNGLKNYFSKKLKGQIAEMAKANPNYAEIKCPIVLIQGAKDSVSRHNRIIPEKEDPKFLTKRREILKKIFKNSPNVDMLVPEKMGHHGLPHFRPKDVAESSIFLLKRYWRDQKKSAGKSLPETEK